MYRSVAPVLLLLLYVNSDRSVRAVKVSHIFFRFEIGRSNNYNLLSLNLEAFLKFKFIQTSQGYYVQFRHLILNIYKIKDQHMLISILFKIDTLEEAEKALQGRVSMVAKRFREPANTDEEFKKIQSKRKKTEKKDLKTKQEEAHSMNIKYLVEEMKMQTPSVRQLSIDSQALAEDTLSILNPTPASPLTIHQLSKDSPASTAESISSIVTPKLVMSPTLRHSPKVSVVSIVDNNPTVLRKDSPTSIEASISSIVSPTLSSPSKVHNFPKISSTTVDNISTIMLPVVSTPKTIRYLSKNSHESVEEEVLYVESMTPAARNLSMDAPLSSLSTVQQLPALSEISFDLSSLGIPYDDILRDLFSEETQIGQNLFEVQIVS